MSSFGDKLRQERVSRGVSLDEISGATGVDRVFLEALEENRFELLTGPAFGKLYVRAYAAVLGFDPEPLIEDYDRERYGRAREQPSATRVKVRPEAGEEETDGNGAKPPKAGGAETAPARPGGVAPEEPPVPFPDEPIPTVSDTGVEGAPSQGRRSMRAPVIVAVVSLAALLALAWAVRSILGGGGEEPRSPATVTSEHAATPREEALPGTSDEPSPGAPSAAGAKETPGPAEPPAPRPEPATAREPASEPVAATGGRLSVPDFGVGLRVVARRLEGKGERFTEGASVSFLTRVLGGRAGESVRHVWLREGAVVQTVELPLGGSHWRTHSRKTLHGLGHWTVEARDAQGRVLARADFTCVPAEP
jgi:transcriptional regulator with XRE-family HTH domain